MDHSNSEIKFITSALPYVNSVPHMGNLIGSTLSGDICARFYRLLGYNVIYLCGTDEYGTTTIIKAKKENLTCQDICDKYHKLHKEIYDWFNIQFDVWGRTTTSEQTKITHEIFSELFKNNCLEEKEIVQMYCDKCQIFLADRYIKGICYHDECRGKNSIANGDQCDACQKMIDTNKLINPFCYSCNNTPTPKKTVHLYLKLAELSEEILHYLENRTQFKANVMSIAKSWLNTGLTSRCITRDLNWGTPVPISIDPILEKYQDKVFYVWFDAPFGYYSILAHAIPNWKELLQSSNLEWISTQAKDNIPFHTIVFPASILGSKLSYPLINKICSTDYLLYEGKKFSKSEGVGLFGDQVMNISKKMNINEDYWRFYLVKIRPETQDSSFSLEDFVSTIETDLVNNIGNFINRCISLTNKFCQKQTSYVLDDQLEKYIKKYIDIMNNFKFRNALKLCLKLANNGNKYIQLNQPWVIAKTDLNATKNIIAQANAFCFVLLHLLHPFIPKTAARMLSYMGCELVSITELISKIGYNLKDAIQMSKANAEYIINIQTTDHTDLAFKKISLDEINIALGE